MNGGEGGNFGIRVEEHVGICNNIPQMSYFRLTILLHQ